MTDDNPAPAADDVLEVLDRRGLLRALSTAITETAERVSGERFRPREGDRERLQYLRALAALVGVYNGVITSTHDRNLDGLPEIPPPPTPRQLERQRRQAEQDELLADMVAGIRR